MSVSVVVPVKDHLEHTRRFFAHLLAADGWDEVLVFDNGSTDGTQEWVRALDDERVELFERSGVNLHAMWNEGRRRARSTKVAVLNNDITFPPDMFRRLEAVLDADVRLGAVSPSLGDLGGGTHRRMDLLGFAFMFRNIPEVPVFNEDYVWYFGDTEFWRALRAAGMEIACVGDVVITHVGGGSTPEGSELLKAGQTVDKDLFFSRWSE